MDVTASTALAFAFTSLLIELTPGPNMTYLALDRRPGGPASGICRDPGVALGIRAGGPGHGLGPLRS